MIIADEVSKATLSTEQATGEMLWVPTSIFNIQLVHSAQGVQGIDLANDFFVLTLIAFMTVVETSMIERVKPFDTKASAHWKPST